MWGMFLKNARGRHRGQLRNFSRSALECTEYLLHA